jgi:hypothetical protein
VRKRKGQTFATEVIVVLKNTQQTRTRATVSLKPAPLSFNQKHVLQHFQVYLIQKISNVTDLLKVTQKFLNRID